MKNILVIGGLGFIGLNTSIKLIEEGYKVKILDSINGKIHKNLNFPDTLKSAEIIVGDVNNIELLGNMVKNVSHIINFAAYQDYCNDFTEFANVNTRGTCAIYEAIVSSNTKIEKVLIASSQAVYGEGKYVDSKGNFYYPDIRTENNLSQGNWEIIKDGVSNLHSIQTDERITNPQNQYAISKYTQELFGLNIGKRFGIPTNCMRYSIVQGKYQSPYNNYSGACRIFCSNLKHDRPITVYEDGLQTRDFVNIDDVVDANLLLLFDKKMPYQSFNVGGGKTYTLLEFAKLCCEVFNKKDFIEISNKYRFGDTRHIFSDISKIKQLGWSPKRTVTDSLEAYKSFISRYNISSELLERTAKHMEETKVIRDAKS